MNDYEVFRREMRAARNAERLDRMTQALKKVSQAMATLGVKTEKAVEMMIAFGRAVPEDLCVRAKASKLLKGRE